MSALVVACPGAGKTTMALRHAHDLLTEGEVERVVIVCPTNHLRHQWAGSAHRGGIDIDANFSNDQGREAAGFAGIAVTYQQVVRCPDLYRLQCRDAKTLVILDECHHAGDELTWGTAIQIAFEHAARRLCLSGTPFRSDDYKIPFVTYSGGRCLADFEYSYGDALADDVCRPIFFPSFEGHAEWLSRDGQLKRHTLLEQLDRSLATERLRTILDPRSGWIRGVFERAHDRLTQIRADGHVDAAGLVVAVDQNHARELSKVLREVTGVEPVLIISDLDDASAQIGRFARGSAPWVVAVKMISEGVDIPRLRVCVFASNVSSVLFFRQVCGRVLRCVPQLEDQYAVVYLPALEPYVTYALEIKREHDRQLRQDIDRTVVTEGGGGGGGTSLPFTPLSAQSRAHELVFDGGRYSRSELDRAQRLGRSLGLRVQPEQIAALIRAGAAEAGVFLRHEQRGTSEEDAATEPLSERLRVLRRNVCRLANQLASRLDVDVRDVHTAWIAQGGSPQRGASEADLLGKQAWLVRRLREEGHGRTAA